MLPRGGVLSFPDVLASAPLHGLRLLVVEDDETIRASLADLLCDEGATLATVANGREALEALRRAPEPPDLILLDLMMPVMDGREFRQVQRSEPELDAIPVLLLTAHANQEQAVAGMGAIKFVRKPVDLDKLLDSLAELCGGPPDVPPPAAGS